MTPKAPSAPEFDQAALDRTVTGPGRCHDRLSDTGPKAGQGRKQFEAAILRHARHARSRRARGLFRPICRGRDSANGSYDQACIMAMTALKGRRVSYYLYADYGENSGKDARATLFGLLQKANAGIGRSH